MGTLADSLFNVLMGWVRALVNGIWALFTTDHTTLLEFLGKNWIMIVVVILAAGLAIDWLVWLIRWRPYHLWAKRARRFLHLPEPEEEETGRRKKRPETGEATQKMQTVEAPEEDAFEDEEQWLPLQQPQVDERQAQEVLQRAQSVPDEELGYLFNTVRKVADIKGIAESGYRVIVNTNDDAQQSVHHIHVHVLGGAPMNSGDPSRK